MAQVIVLAIAVHTVIQACLGVALGQPVQALCAAVALPAVLLVAAMFAWVVDAVLCAVGVY